MLGLHYLEPIRNARDAWRIGDFALIKTRHAFNPALGAVYSFVPLIVHLDGTSWDTALLVKSDHIGRKPLGAGATDCLGSVADINCGNATRYLESGPGQTTANVPT
jgi:hypothetical protein